MEYLPIIHQIQKEQLQNPLRRYKEVREYYAEAMEENCIFYHLGSFLNHDYMPHREPFPKSLFPPLIARASPLLMLFNPTFYRVLPITLKLAEEICEKYRVTGQNIKSGFEWDHHYAVCPEIKVPLTSIQESEEARHKEWIKVTPQWALNAVQEFNNPEIL